MRSFALGATAIAALLMAQVTAASASAAQPKFLPGSGHIALKGGATLLETTTGLAVKCSSLSGSGELTSETMGTIELTLEGCRSRPIETTCTGSSDPPGDITLDLSGQGHNLTANLTSAAQVFSQRNPTGFSCLLTSVAVTGTFACPIAPVNKKVKTTEHYTDTCKQSKGHPEVTSVENAAETGKESVQLKVSVNGGTEEEAAVETTVDLAPSVESELMD